MSVPSFDVVGGGAAAVDDILFVAGHITDGKAQVVRRERRFGGNVSTTLVAAARSAATAAFIGHLPGVASDAGLLDHLRAEGVVLEYARVSAETRAIHSTILVGTEGERFIAFDDMTSVGLPDDLNLDLVTRARVLVLDAYGIAGAIRAARAARAARVAVVVDIERALDPRTGEMLGLADHLVLPLDFALNWTGARTAAQAVTALWRADRSAVVVTGGADGCWYRSADHGGAGSDLVSHRPAVPVRAKDTTGCGDVFHGVYAANLAAGASVADCIAAATVAGAECATHVGGIGPATTRRAHTGSLEECRHD